MINNKCLALLFTENKNISNRAHNLKSGKTNKPILEHVHSFEANLGKISSGIVKGFDDFFAPGTQQPAVKSSTQKLSTNQKRNVTPPKEVVAGRFYFFTSHVTNWVL